MGGLGSDEPVVAGVGPGAAVTAGGLGGVVVCGEVGWAGCAWAVAPTLACPWAGAVSPIAKTTVKPTERNFHGSPDTLVTIFA